MNELPTGSLPRISSIPGPRGPKGDPGTPGTNGSNGVSPQTVTTASFVMPAAAAEVTVAVGNTSWTAAGQPIYIESAGSFVVTTVLSATSLRLTAQNATGNTVAGTVISSGKKVVPGAQMVMDATITDALSNRVTSLESSPQGNRSWYSSSAPTNTNGQLRTGDIWFDTDDGYKMYRWDGTAWNNVQRVLDLPDFGTGIRPIVKVTSLPVSGYNDGDFVWLQTDGKLYRRSGGVWTKAVATGDLVGQIDGTMIVDGTLVAQKLAANSVTADKIGANQIITQAANIADGVITDAKIGTLSAGKITAGNIQAVNLGYAGGIFHPDYISGAYAGRYFRTTEFGTSFGDGHVFGTGSSFTFTHSTPVTAYGPGNASWRINGSPAMCPDALGRLLVQIQGRLIGYSAGSVTVYCRVNGGQYVALASRNSQDGNSAVIDCQRIMTGITPDSRIEFFVAPCDGNGNLNTSVTCRFELDVVCFNW
jgi:hypothetical protein